MPFLKGFVPGHVDILGKCQNCQEYATFARLSRGHSLFGQTLRVISCTGTRQMRPEHIDKVLQYVDGGARPFNPCHEYIG